MMFLFGLISVFQICFLPGLLLLKVTKYPFHSWIESFILLFASSLFLNYLIVFLLAALHLYTKPILSAAIAIEILLDIFFYRRQIIRWLRQPISSPIDSIRTSGFPNGDHWSLILIGITGAVCFSPVILTFFQNIGTVFTGWDPAVSWNQWALTWSQNSIPMTIDHYPQVLPTNWSIGYVLMGTPIEFFSKAVTGLFWVYTICILFLLAHKEKPLPYIIAVLATVYFYVPYMGIAVSGYAEVPVMFYWTFGIYAILEFLSQKQKEKAIWYLYAATIAFLGSALVKQTGLYTVLVCPLLLLSIRNSIKSVMTKRQITFFVFVNLLFLLFTVVPFYYLCQYWILKGINGDGISTILITMHNNRNLTQRFLYAINLLTHAFPPFMLITSGIFSLFSLKNRLSRRVLLLLVLPYAILWSIGFSYEVRLLLPVISLYAITVGIGFDITVKEILHIFRKIRFKNWTLIILLLCIIGGACISIPDRELVIRNDMAKMDIGEPEVNHYLFTYTVHHPITKMIFTDYIPLTLFPKLSGLTKIGAFITNADIHGYLDAIADPNTGYVLMPVDADQRLLDDVQKRLRDGSFILEAQLPTYLFIRIAGR